MERPTTPQLVAIVAVLAVFVAARFWNLTASCLWFDEIFSVHAAEHSWSGMFNFVALDLIHPPLFYVVLKTWTSIGGEELFWLRLLPVIFSIIAIVPFVLFCRELRLTTWTTVLAFLLIAVNGPMIKYAQEVRMYSMLLCLSLFSMWLFSRFLRSGNGIIILTVFNILLVFTHYFGWLVIAAEIVAIIAANRELMKPIAVSLGITSAAFVPWAIAILNAASSGSGLKQNIGWMNRPGLSELAATGLNFVEPFYFRSTSIDPLSLYLVSIPIAVTALVCVVVNFYKGKTSDASTASVLLPLIFFAVPLAIAFAASWLLPYSVWGSRHLIIVFAPFAILFAESIAELPLTRFIGIPIILTLSVVGFALTLDRGNPPLIWCGYDAAAEEISSGDGRSIFVFEDLAAYHLWFAVRSQRDAPTIVKVNGVTAMPEDPSYFLPRGFDGVAIQDYEASYPADFWIVYRSSKYDVNGEPLRSFIQKGYSVTDERIDDFGYAKLIAVRFSKSEQP